MNDKMVLLPINQMSDLKKFHERIKESNFSEDLKRIFIEIINKAPFIVLENDNELYQKRREIVANPPRSVSELICSQKCYLEITKIAELASIFPERENYEFIRNYGEKKAGYVRTDLEKDVMLDVPEGLENHRYLLPITDSTYTKDKEKIMESNFSENFKLILLDIFKKKNKNNVVLMTPQGYESSVFNIEEVNPFKSSYIHLMENVSRNSFYYIELTCDKELLYIFKDYLVEIEYVKSFDENGNGYRLVSTDDKYSLKLAYKK